MKYYKITIVGLFFCIAAVKAKAQVPDTAQYLLDSIQPKLSYYIGKPLKVLLNELKIQPVYYHSIPRWDMRLKNKDTIQLLETLLYFTSLDNVLARRSLDIKSPAIEIIFAQPIPVLKEWYMRGGRFENDNWDKFKRHFYEKYIIGEIALRGI